MTASRSDKAGRSSLLHQGPGAFVIPNPWDAGSARILAGLGFRALATSSGASAGIVGRRDGKVTRDEALAHARASCRRPIFRSRPIWKKASETPRKRLRKPFASPAGWAWSAAPSRTRRAIRTAHSMTSATRRNGWRRACRRHVRSPSRSTLAAARGELPPRDPNLQRHRSSACRRSSGRGPTCSSPPALPDSATVREVCAALSKTLQLHGRHQRQIVHGGRASDCGCRANQLATSPHPRPP